jgi:hypothetical protein
MLFDNFTPYLMNHNVPFDIIDIVSPHCEKPNKNYNYVFNSDGLRTIELSTKPNVITMGCSITFGLGLPVEKIWPSILENKIQKHGDYKVGNISYNGASIMKNVSNFFGFINKYDYVPEYLICNFANFERALFHRTEKNGHTFIGDIFWSKDRFMFEDKYPYTFENILPVEWIYRSNLDHIKMLETFCKQNNIKLIWSTWSNNLSSNDEELMKKYFFGYVPDPTRKIFPGALEGGGFSNPDSDMSSVLKGFKMKNWDNVLCHEEYKEDSNDYPFHYAYDYHYNLPDISMRLPHTGYHRHLHWAEFYYQEMMNKINLTKINNI